jgi:hypothetical protein
MIKWTKQAIKVALETYNEELGTSTQEEAFEEALKAAAYEQLLTQDAISMSAGVATFYDVGFKRAIESCALALEQWEADVGVAKEARGRLPKLVRELQK